ncbi:unnamed protein product [Schistosoma margrebowiei]|uniref:Uncharacterized protein n=1 Tax=Schistosoma margrebowiei TaxID=48269 RepID=A0A183N9V2_9TREM|nr:unnamed protein product [Schistosoma margrebowiei]
METMESVGHSVNNGIYFTESSPHVYKFITECPENLSNSGDNSYNFTSDSELDSQLRNNSVQLINISEVNDDTSFSDIHPPGSKRRLCSNVDGITDMIAQQPCFTDERNSCEKLTRGKQKIPIEFISDRTKRYSTFSKRKTGLMKKAVELAELTGAEVLLLVASETNHVYTFATQRLKGIIELECGKKLIQTCLSSSVNPNNSSMKSDQPDLNSSQVNKNVNSRKSCKKEDSTVIVNSDTFGKKEYVSDLKNVSNKNSKVNSTLQNDAVPKLLNQNHVDELEQRIDIIPSTIIDSGQNGHTVSLNDEAFCNNISQATNISNSSECKKVVYVPVSVSPSQNVLSLTPLSSSLLLTAQMATNQLLLVPQLNSVHYVTSSSGNVLNSSLNTPTSNSCNPYLMGFLNVNTNNGSSEILTNCVTKESTNFTSKSSTNESVTNQLMNNSCKYNLKPPD